MNTRLRSFFAAALGTLFLFGAITAPASGRVAVRGNNGLVASSSALASEVGIDIMRKGGQRH